MPTTPYAKLLVSVNAAASVSGAVTVANAAVIQLSGENTAGWRTRKYELYSFYSASEFPLPSGWTDDGNGVYSYSLGDIPPPFTLPASPAWGKWLPRLTVNNGLNGDGAVDPTLVDESTGLSLPGPGGFLDFAHLESAQFSAIKKWVADQQTNLRLVDALVALGTTSVTFANVKAALALANTAVGFNGQKLTGIATPTISTDAATKGYTDSADASLVTSLSTETSTRASADTSLTTRLSTEESTRSSANTSLTTRVSTEESTRGSAGTSLTTRISTEESTRGSAVTSLTTRVSSEESVRTANVASIDTRFGQTGKHNMTFGASTIALSGTDYLPPGYIDATARTNPVKFRVAHRVTITLIKYFCRTAGSGAGTITFTVRKSGSSQDVLTVAANATSGSAAVSITISEDQELDIEVTRSALLDTAPLDPMITLGMIG